MALHQREQSNKKKEDKMKELKTFIQRFSANASKSRQASSRKALLDKITLDDIRPSSRKYPYIVFSPERDLGKDVLFADGLCKSVDGVKLFEDLRFSVGRGERVALVGDDRAVTALLDILAGVEQPDSGELQWGRTVSRGYFPKDSEAFFAGSMKLTEWLHQYSTNHEENFVRSFLGRMLFSGDDVQKQVSVLSGGEKVRCMLARAMLQQPNVLLLDGPTNHLDLESITALNNGLLKFEGTMIFSSHDVQFVASLADRVIELGHSGHRDLGLGYEEDLADAGRHERIAGAV
jgi:ATPase subunit of ABC transporter with duplicated ATPase domains